ncbi:hypothetical protein SmJEL517_g03156 [Synchytrium microbalum]|uniref:Uncharacterized protein n=1 Tax=Synchytrium microbalum TaxID=1806994 RepID=A0A507C854_9FUNG|nr:uncharacterized protein SmJEL517_g03156 [Synchytrium microbalum]TPX34176.1 hypothetical protein SmJEL517_g03156 [Synchytrium microbalum]
MAVGGTSEDNWIPLTATQHGLVILPFTPLSLSSYPSAINLDPQKNAGTDSFMTATSAQISLEVGDSVHIIECGGVWYRGYVYSCVETNAAPRLGIFPANHISIQPREYMPPTPIPSAVTSPMSASVPTSAVTTDTPLPPRNQSLFLSLASSMLPTDSRMLPVPQPPVHATQAGYQEPLVDEVAAVAREWSACFKTLLLQQNYALFKTVRQLFYSLLQGRRQLLAHTLSQDELAKLRRELISKMVAGNRMLGLDLVVWNAETGSLVSEMNTSISKMYQMYIQADSTTSLSINTSQPISMEPLAVAHPPSPTSATSMMSPPLPPVKIPAPLTKAKSKDVIPNLNYKPTTLDELVSRLTHLHIELKACVASICAPGETAELYFSLYNKAESRTVTEDYVVVLNHLGMPTDGDRIGKMQNVFVDLSHRDLNENTFLVCKIVRVGRMNVNDRDTNNGSASTGPSSSHVRRPVGWAIQDLGDLVHNFNHTNEYLMRIYVPTSEAMFGSLHENLVNRLGGYDTSNRAEHLVMQLKVIQGDWMKMYKNNQLGEAVITPRNGFTDVISPGDVRNEMYLTLVAGDFASSKGKNVEVAVQVRMPSGEVVDGCISRGAGVPNISAYESTVYYHTAAPKWNETIRLDLPVDTFEKLHIFFAFRHCSSSNRGREQEKKDDRTFAFAFLPLIMGNRAVLADSQHALTLYRWDRKMSYPAIYLTFPAGPTIFVPKQLSTASLDELSAAADAMSKIPPSKDTFSVRSRLCSTKFTQNQALVNLLNWRLSISNHRSAVESILKELIMVGESEIIVFLPDILDKIFEILEQRGVSDGNVEAEVEDLAFAAVVFILGIVQDKRFTHHKSVLDAYIEKRFVFRTAHYHLLNSFQQLLSNPADISKAKDLRSAIKVWQYIIRFCVKSYAIERKEPTTTTPEEFAKSVKSLLDAVNFLMGLTTPEHVIGAQGFALQHFAALIPDLTLVLTHQQLVKSVVAFADASRATSRTTIAMARLQFITNIIRGPMFQDRPTRVILMPHIVRWLRDYVSVDFYSAGGEVNNKVTASKAMREKEANRTVAATTSWSLIAELIEILETEKAQKAAEKEVDSMVLAVADLLPQLMEAFNDLVHATAPTTESAGAASVGLLGTIEEYDSGRESVAAKPEATPPLPTVSTLSSGSGSDKYSDIMERSGTERPRSVRTASSVFNLRAFAHVEPLATSPPLAPVSLSPHTQNSGSSSIGAVMRESSQITLLSSALRPELGELATVILAVFKLLDKPHISSLMTRLFEKRGPVSFVQVLSSLFGTLQALIDEQPFPSKWAGMYYLSQRLAIHVLQPVSEILSKEFLPGSGLVTSGALSTAQSNQHYSVVWNDFFRLLEKILNSPRCQIERFGPLQAWVASKVGADIRADGGKILHLMWEELSSAARRVASTWDAAEVAQFERLTRDLVGPFLQLTVSANAELKRISAGLLASMIAAEFQRTGDFVLIQGEWADVLDRLIVAQGRGDESYRAFLVGELNQKFSQNEHPWTDPVLHELGARFIDQLDHFLELTLILRSLPFGDEHDHERMEAILEVLKFARCLERKHIYVKYVHSLSVIHLEHDNIVEAALALKLHSDLLDWNNQLKVEPLPSLGFPRWQTASERKMEILHIILQLLERGRAWERAIDLANELKVHYSSITFEYKELASILRKEAQFYEAILSGNRVPPNYYRVSFYGLSCPSALRGKQFVYRAGEGERLGGFCEAMLNQYPDAQVVRSKSFVGEDISSGVGMYIQVIGVNPEPDVRRWLKNEGPSGRIRWSLTILDATQSIDPDGNPDMVPLQILEPDLGVGEEELSTRALAFASTIPESIRSYYETNEIDCFSFSRPVRRTSIAPSNDPAREFLELWTERTVILTADRFPCLLKRSEVIATHTFEISPIENAIIAVRGKNRQLLELERKYLAPTNVAPNVNARGQAASRLVGGNRTSGREKDININPFTMAINGAIDAPVNGGVPMYRRAFLAPEFRKSHPKFSGLVEVLAKAIDDQVEITHRCLFLHGILVPAQMKPLHDNLVVLFQKNFGEEITRLGLPDHTTLPATGTISSTAIGNPGKVQSSIDSIRQALQLSGSGGLDSTPNRSMSAYTASANTSQPDMPPTSSGYSIFRRNAQPSSRENDPTKMKRASTSSALSTSSSGSGGTNRISLTSKASLAKLSQAMGLSRPSTDQ